MIDLANYKRAIPWLKRGIAELSKEPENKMVRYGVFHCVGVTYNVTECTLRQALAQVSDDELIPGLSSRELMRFAADEGLTLSSPQVWLQYGLAIKRSNETLEEAFNESILPILPQYVRELEDFSIRLEGRLK